MKAPWASDKWKKRRTEEVEERKVAEAKISFCLLAFVHPKIKIGQRGIYIKKKRKKKKKVFFCLPQNKESNLVWTDMRVSKL